jgi:hypothetical protein
MNRHRGPRTDPAAHICGFTAPDVFARIAHGCRRCRCPVPAHSRQEFDAEVRPRSDHGQTTVRPRVRPRSDHESDHGQTTVRPWVRPRSDRTRKGVASRRRLGEADARRCRGEATGSERDERSDRRSRPRPARARRRARGSVRRASSADRRRAMRRSRPGQRRLCVRSSRLERGLSPFGESLQHARR